MSPMSTFQLGFRHHVGEDPPANVLRPWIDTSGDEPVLRYFDDPDWIAVGGISDVPGPQGDAGWSPILAVEEDGARRVHRVVGWTGGEGDPPATGSYVGPAGLVATAAEATDLRGPAGAGTGDVLGPEGGVADGELVVFDGDSGKVIGGSGVAPAVLARRDHVEALAIQTPGGWPDRPAGYASVEWRGWDDPPGGSVQAGDTWTQIPEPA